MRVWGCERRIATPASWTYRSGDLFPSCRGSLGTGEESGKWRPTCAAVRTNLDIYDPDRYVDGVPHDVFDYLRVHQPVFWQDMPDEPGYWAVLKHADVVEVARQPNLYSASEGGVVLEDLAPDQLTMMRDMLLAMDPPRHTGYRQPLAASFKARVIGKLETRVRAIVATILDQAQQAGEVEFVHDVTSFLPSQIVGELMGLPKEDLPQINRWAEMNTSGQDPDLNPES